MLEFHLKTYDHAADFTYLQHRQRWNWYPSSHMTLGKTRRFTEMSDCSFNECAREKEPHCHRCTSPQLIALCVGVRPLYSTPDKMCVSVHDACKDKNNRTRSDERVCVHHAFHATSYATFISQDLWQIYKSLGSDSNRQTDHEISGSNTVLRDVPGCALTKDHIRLLLHQGHRTHQL